MEQSGHQIAAIGGHAPKRESGVTTPIPLTRASMTDQDRQAVQAAMSGSPMEGGGAYSRLAEQALIELVGAKAALITHSGTGALEMAMLLADIQPGDEVIMPSFTFSSTANAVILRGGIPVFADIEPNSFNLSSDATQAAITDKTRVLMPVHYAGVGCDMERLGELCQSHQLIMVEDAAHAIGASWNSRPLGSFGTLGAFSFHATKNISCGEGGALVINDESLKDRAEILLEKGTSRRLMMRGDIDKYTWVDVGSSFLPSEMTAALLVSQLNRIEAINGERLAIWNRYAQDERIVELCDEGLVRLQHIPSQSSHNAHLFCLILPSPSLRDGLSRALGERRIAAYRHYVPLHDAPAGLRFGRASGSMQNTIDIAERLIRLPLFPGLLDEQIDHIVDCVYKFLKSESQ